MKTVLTSLTALAFFALVSPASAADITILGNARGSENTVNFRQNTDTTLVQSNNTRIVNDVNVNQNTGGNSISDTWGGDSHIETGDAISNVSINNKAGMNTAQISGCTNCDNTHIDISGNGRNSESTVNYRNDSDTIVVQRNDTDIVNDVDVNNNTGNNSTGGSFWGDSHIETGDAVSNVSINNEAGKNVANISGGNGGNTHINVSDNGRNSENTVNYSNDSRVTVVQDNDTDIHNDVDVNNNTGGNSSEHEGYPFFKHYYPKNWDHDWDHDYDHDKWQEHPWKKYDHGYKNYHGAYLPYWVAFFHDKHNDHGKHYDSDHGKTCEYNWYKKEYECEKDKHYSKYPYYKVVKHHDYDKDHKEYEKKHAYFPKYYVKDYDHDCNWSCDRDYSYKKQVKPVFVYVPKKNYDNDKYSCYDKNQYGGKHVSFKKYPYGHNWDYGWNKKPVKYAKHNNHDYPWWKSGSWHPHNFGGGNTSIRTGDAVSNVNINNSAGSNYFSMN